MNTDKTITHDKTESDSMLRYRLEREAEQKRADAKWEENYAKIKAVAKILGFTINEEKLKENKGYIELNNPNGASFDFTCITYSYHCDEKFEIRGNYSYNPNDCGAIKYNESSPRIGISWHKTPEQIAKDIQRRFLPEYLEIEAKCKAYKESKSNRIETRNQKLKELAEYCGQTFTLPTWRNNDHREDFSLPDSNGKCESYDGESFSMEIRNLNEEQVKLILKLLPKEKEE